MAIPSREIGWSTTANLLWQISKQLEYLTCVTAGGCTTTTTSTTSEPTTTTTTTVVSLVEQVTQFGSTCGPCETCPPYANYPIYAEQSCIDTVTVGCHFYANLEGTINADEGYYLDWNSEGYFYVDVNGLVLNINICPQP